MNAPPFATGELWEAADRVMEAVGLIESSPKWQGKPRAYKLWILALLLGKSVKTFRAITRLCQEGYGEDSGLLLRSLFQNLVTIRYLTAQDTRERVARYRAYDPVIVAQLVRPRRNDADFMATWTASGGEAWKVLDRRAKRAKTRFTYSYGAFGWANTTLEKAANDVGLQAIYDSLYRVESQYEHSSMWALAQYQSPSNFLIQSAPSNKDVGRTLRVAITLMKQIVFDVAGGAQLGLMRKLRPYANVGGIT